MVTLRVATVALVGQYALAATCAVPPPPEPEPIELVRLALPPGIGDESPGACNTTVNPRRTGCMPLANGRDFMSGDFLPDGNNVLAMVRFVGAPPPPDPASFYNGSQIIIVKADDSSFANGEKWKCITCGLPAENEIGRSDDLLYPQAFDDGKRALVGDNIVDCGNFSLTSEECTPERTHVYPLRWNTAADDSGEGARIRELRLHPDNVHLGFSAFILDGAVVGLPLAPRYDIVNVSVLLNPNNSAVVFTDGDDMFIDRQAVSVGELRGFSGPGDEIIYVGYPWESSNLDAFAVHMQTGKVRAITNHPEYIDPIDGSPDGKWWAIMDTRGTNRQMFLAGMRHVPPITDLVSVGLTSSTRNNGARRFFVPYLLDNYGDRGTYFGQKINGPGFGELGSGTLNDPQWNGQADPRWSPDSTKVVYWEAQTVSPACGGANPLPCFASMEPEGKDVRMILAKFTSRTPSEFVPVDLVSDEIPWAVAYTPGDAAPMRRSPSPGTYRLAGQVTGYASVVLTGDSSIVAVSVSYSNYSDDGTTFLNGNENVTNVNTGTSIVHLDWFSDLVQTGPDLYATKTTSPDGFHGEIDVLVNIFNANGTLTTTINGQAYEQPLNGA
ncbi:hypothetical protein GQ53DRAFT_811736 [Thozetella sp. PMI_491]|nr:hypothetical protein GQ53DRAFT_811736 [Thozetella sp. PMI_491]